MNAEVGVKVSGYLVLSTDRVSGVPRNVEATMAHGSRGMYYLRFFDSHLITHMYKCRMAVSYGKNRAYLWEIHYHQE